MRGAVTDRFTPIATRISISTLQGSLWPALMRLTIDLHDNELKMSAWLTDKYSEILQKMGAKQVVKQPRKPRHYSISDVASLRRRIMGDNPGNSALTYLQSWDVPNCS